MAIQGGPNSGGRNGFIFMAVIFILFGLLLAFFIGNRAPGLFEIIFGERLGEPSANSAERADATHPDTSNQEENNAGTEADQALTAVEIMNMGGSTGGVVSQTNDYGTAAIAGN